MSEQKMPVKYDENVSFIRSAVNQIRLVGRLMVDPRVPGVLKLLPIGSAIYMISPADILMAPLPPVVTQMDDLAVAFLGLKMFIEFCPPHVVDEHMRAINGQPPPRDITAEVIEEIPEAGYEPDPVEASSRKRAAVEDAEVEEIDE